MKVKTLALMAGATAALAITSSAMAGGHFSWSIDHNTTDPWLVSNGLQSMTLTLHIGPGNQGLGLLGVVTTPWTVSTSFDSGNTNLGSGFHNHTANVTALGGAFVLWDNGAGNNIVSARGAALQKANVFGEGLVDSAFWDSGYTQQLIDLFGTPGPQPPVNNWAISNSGDNVNHSPMFGISLSPVDLPETIVVYHVTWSALEWAHGSFIFQFTEPTFDEIPVTWSLPPVPAPGALALLGLAGLAGARRRRA